MSDLHDVEVTLNIELDQLSINDALLRYAANGITTAVMTDEISVFNWRPFHGEWAVLGKIRRFVYLSIPSKFPPISPGRPV